jgi:hypothetical protein
MALFNGHLMVSSRRLLKQQKTNHLFYKKSQIK